MARTQAVYYRSADGFEPVRAFIICLQPRRQAAVLRQIARLNGRDPAAPPLAFPFSSQVRGELRELRCHFGSEHYRVLYRRSDNLLVLLHVIRKTTGRLPFADVEVAESRWKDFKRRMSRKHARSSRPAGHDAP